MGAPKGGGPKISLLFFLLPSDISPFLLSLGVFSWNFGGVLEAGTPKCARLGSRAVVRNPGGPR